MNYSRKVTIQGNIFEDNYQHPYDQAGGTMNTTSCDYDTRVLANTFTAWGLTGANYTQALELHGHKELVQANNMRGYPYDVINARSINSLVVDGNTMEANGRIPGFDESAIHMWNQENLRRINGVTIMNNLIANPAGAPPSIGTLKYAVRFSIHRCTNENDQVCRNNTGLDPMNSVEVFNNQFNYLRSASEQWCIMNGVVGSGWGLFQPLQAYSTQCVGLQ